MEIRRFILFVLLLTATVSYSQKYECGFYGKKTVAQRNQVFPFNKAKKVLLIAYDDYTLKAVPRDTSKILSPKVISKWEAKWIDDTMKKYTAIEEVKLLQPDIDKLSNILVNYTLKKNPRHNYLIGSSCYFPRNAILFLDENENVVSCLEICFECAQSVFFPDPADLNQYAQVEECYPRLQLIKEIFNKNGIKYGVEER